MSGKKISVFKKIEKYYEFVLTKGYLLLNQKKYCENDVCLKYLFEKQESDVLIVVFSSCTRKGIRARYNYRKTLQNVECNKLFLLDDFAEDHRGSYYIGKDNMFGEEKVTENLIKKTIADTGANKLIFTGSSKGGWAALNFGMMFDEVDIICGGPQFWLGSYLLASGNEITLDYILGERSEEKIGNLDCYLKNKIEQAAPTGKRIYIHYSNKEHTYVEHIKDLLECLREYGYSIEEDVADYENHSDISYFFPGYLQSMAKRLVMHCE